MDNKVFEVSKDLMGHQEVLEILAVLVSLVRLVRVASRAVVEQLGLRERWVTLEVLGTLDHLVSLVLQETLDKWDLMVCHTAIVSAHEHSSQTHFALTIHCTKRLK